jgi:hypothetical protein
MRVTGGCQHRVVRVGHRRIRRKNVESVIGRYDDMTRPFGTGFTLETVDATFGLVDDLDPDIEYGQIEL